jgi:hypothetical protein
MKFIIFAVLLCMPLAVYTQDSSTASASVVETSWFHHHGRRAHKATKHHPHRVTKHKVHRA